MSRSEQHSVIHDHHHRHHTFRSYHRRQVKFTGDQPCHRFCHVGVVYQDAMFVFGKFWNNHGNCCRPSLVHVKMITVSSVVLLSHPSHFTLFDATQLIFELKYDWIGGYDGSERLNEFIRFDFAAYDLSFEVPSSTLIADLRQMVNDDTLSDITFIVEDQPVYAHKLMLMR